MTKSACLFGHLRLTQVGFLSENVKKLYNSELEFLKRLWGLGTREEEGYRTGPPGYIGWRNSFLEIDSGAPYTFKNTSSASFSRNG
jgi:hypothetical protein